MTEERKEIIKAFCRFIDNYDGEMIIRGNKIYNTKNDIIYATD